MIRRYLAVAFFWVLIGWANAQQNTAPPWPPSPNDTSVKIFTFVEQQPQFPGGEGALLRFLQQNVHYPALERDNGIQGKVIIKFVVDEQGKVREAEVARGVSPGLDKEALRVIKMLPDFIPGRQQGRPVRVFFNIPVQFKLERHGIY